MNTTPIQFMAWDNLNKTMKYELEIHMVSDCINEFFRYKFYNFMQLTALRSINNEPIYNHMIVKDEEGDYYVVDMFNYDLMFMLSESHIEIVGNRFQNPELLELCK